MAGFDYEALRDNTVIPLLGFFGRPMLLRRRIPAGVDRDTGAVMYTEDLETFTGVFLSSPRSDRLPQPQETEVRELLGVFDPKKPRPPMDSQVVVDQRDWIVVTVSDVTPGCITALYRVTVSGG